MKHQWNGTQKQEQTAFEKLKKGPYLEPFSYTFQILMAGLFMHLGSKNPEFKGLRFHECRALFNVKHEVDPLPKAF